MGIHSPWLNSADVIIVTANYIGRVIGGVVIREYRLNSGEKIGLIGYVCVHQAMRGQGISKKIVHEAIRQAKNQGLSGLTLWTSKPEVYKSFGFYRNDQDCLEKYSALPYSENHKLNLKRSELTSRGIPPFARGVYRVSNKAAALTYMETPLGFAVAEWEGQDLEVIELIRAAAEGRDWWLNAIVGDSLIDVVSGMSSPIDFLPSSRWDLSFNGHEIENLSGIRVLDRV